MDRRTFLKHAAQLGGAAVALPLIDPVAEPTSPPRAQKTAQVVIVKTTDRVAGVSRALDLLGLRRYTGTDVFVKPNYNSADEHPGSTHNDVLTTLVQRLQKAGASKITVGDRSGMGNTRTVMQTKGVFALAKQLNFEAVVFDELKKADWQLFSPAGSHWKQGFALPKPVTQAGAVVQACCLKTHRFGGHFTLSLKNSVGLAAKTLPGDSYNFMTELHGSPHQRRMIAEINTAYAPDFIVMDGLEAYVTGGPDTGKLVKPGVVLASTDRVAIDAVGAAILRHYGTTPEVSKGSLFSQEQIARAVALEIGIAAASQIELVTDDAPSAAFAALIRPILAAG